MSYYLEIQNSTKHDGTFALEDNSKITVYTSERIDRKKHSNNYIKLKDFFIKDTDGRYKVSDSELVYNPFQKIHHHLAHACCSFFSSPFKKATILIIDGMGPYKDGKYVSTSLWKGENNKIKLISMNTEKDFCYNSLGHLYSAVTYYCGFDFWQEGKVMGLASLGSASQISNELDKLMRFLPNGKYRIDKDFIGYCFSLRYKDEKVFEKYCKDEQKYRIRYTKSFGDYRKTDGEIKKNHKDLAWAVQNLLEKSVFHLVNYLRQVDDCDSLCLGGGVALNGVTNGKILESNIFKNIYIPPVCGDDGQALGKLFYKKHIIDNKPRNWFMKDAYLGPEYSNNNVSNAIKKYKTKIKYRVYKKSELLKEAVRFLLDGKIIGWFQGRSEIGPRALGHRSILADPRRAEMKDIINVRIKHREMFRPFAPSILEEYSNEYFFKSKPSPFMLLVFKAKSKACKEIPAVVHVDGTSRVQTINKEDNDIYYGLIKEFHKSTGVPVLLNTSFNDNGEPIVETPEGALKTFLDLDLDVLVINNYIIQKN